eukprot:4429909-Heterocapsa_arctica.AAC.1
MVEEVREIALLPSMGKKCARAAPVCVAAGRPSVGSWCWAPSVVPELRGIHDFDIGHDRHVWAYPGV